MSPRFLTLFEILGFHEELLRDFGGQPGIRDLGLAESAVAMPESGAGAAYAFHLAQNHPFIDGNKRTAFAAALTFLELNGYAVLGGEEELEAATRKLASGELDKKAFAALLEKLYREHKTR